MNDDQGDVITRRRLLRIVGAGMAGAALYGCEIDSAGDPTCGEPGKAEWEDTLDSTSDLFFNDDHKGIGNCNYVFHLGMPDAKWLPNQPGFEVYEGHHGGWGGTLEIINRNAGIYLHWAWDSLKRVYVFPNWEGEVNGSGIAIGSTLTDFLSAFQRASEVEVDNSISDYLGLDRIKGTFRDETFSSGWAPGGGSSKLEKISYSYLAAGFDSGQRIIGLDLGLGEHNVDF